MVVCECVCNRDLNHRDDLTGSPERFQHGVSCILVVLIL